jgi:hypothetical protein
VDDAEGLEVGLVDEQAGDDPSGGDLVDDQPEGAVVPGGQVEGRVGQVGRVGAQ